MTSNNEADAYFARVRDVSGGSVTSKQAYYTFFNKLKLNGLWPEELIPLDGDNVAGARVKAIVGKGAGFRNCQDLGITGSGTVAIDTLSDYNKTTGLRPNSTNKVLATGYDISVLNKQNHTFVTVLTTNERNNGRKHPGTAGSGLGMFLLNETATNSQLPAYNADTRNATSPFNMRFNVKGIHIGVSNTSNVKYWKDGALVGQAAAAGTGNFASSQIGVTLGARTSLIMYYTRALSDTEAQLLNTLVLEFETNRGRAAALFTDTITRHWCIGDSITFGYSGLGTQITQPYPWQLITKRSWVSNEGSANSRYVSNSGVNGRTAATYITQLASNLDFIKTGNYNPSAMNIYCIEFGANDMGGVDNASAATLKGYYDSICGTLKSIGPNVKVIALNMIASTTFAWTNQANYNTQAPIFNGLLAGDVNYTNGVLADGIADISSIDPATQTIDGIHPNNTGAGFMADQVIGVLTTLGYA